MNREHHNSLTTKWIFVNTFGHFGEKNDLPANARLLKNL